MEIGSKGDLAVRLLLFAIANCTVRGLHLRFAYCNLSEKSIDLLAEAVERNTSLVGFSCFQNPCSYTLCEGMMYNPDAPCEQRIRRALVATRAPILIWNNNPLPQDLIQARIARQSISDATVDVHSELLASPSEYSLFLSHAQRDASTEASVVCDGMLRRIPAGSVFYRLPNQLEPFASMTYDMTFKMSEVISRVKTSKNVVVFLTANYCKRPIPMVELHCALATPGVNVIPIIVETTRPSFDAVRINEDIRLGKVQGYFNKDIWDLLNAFDISTETVIRNLQAVTNMDMIRFRKENPENEPGIDALLESIFDRIENVRYLSHGGKSARRL